jgi:hypothetical protein
MLVVDKRDQQVLEGGIFVAALARLPKRIVEGLFELASETRPLGCSPTPAAKAHGL